MTNVSARFHQLSKTKLGLSFVHRRIIRRAGGESVHHRRVVGQEGAHRSWAAICITTDYLKTIGEGPGGELTFCSSAMEDMTPSQL
jgi:hypothetical protein